MSAIISTVKFEGMTLIPIAVGHQCYTFSLKTKQCRLFMHTKIKMCI